MAVGATSLIAGLIFVLTVAGILFRPFGWHEAWFGGAGAALMLATGAVRADGVLAVLEQTAPVLLFLVGVLMVAAVAERAGVFTWAALKAARLAGASPRRLFVASYLLGALVTTFFSLDTTAVVLAPVVLRIVQQAGANPLPFVYLSVYVANVTSLLLPVSNLTNLLVQAQYGLQFWEFARIMSLPALLSAGANLALLYAVFHRQLAGRLDVQGLQLQVRALSRSPFLRWSVLISAATILGFGVAGWLQAPLWPVALAGGTAMAGMALVRREVRPQFFRRAVAWAVIPFVVGLFIVIQGVQATGVGGQLMAAALSPRAAALPAIEPGAPGERPPAPALEGFGDLAALAATSAVGSNVVNNIPMTLLAMANLPPAEATAPSPWGRLAPYALLLGVNIGPTLTVVGSLATILTLTLVRQRGVNVSGWHYLRMGLIMMPPTLTAALLGLAASAR
ncbi:MAG: SLC13 family permease [Bacillota bacterium]